MIRAFRSPNVILRWILLLAATISLAVSAGFFKDYSQSLDNYGRIADETGIAIDIVSPLHLVDALFPFVAVVSTVLLHSSSMHRMAAALVTQAALAAGLLAWNIYVYLNFLRVRTSYPELTFPEFEGWRFMAYLAFSLLVVAVLCRRVFANFSDRPQLSN